VVSKSLLGKAHTVMAEGGVAAAMGNVDDRDSWRVHFADTMRGGGYVNQPRMAEIHAQEAPDRVRELEKVGSVVRPHSRREDPPTELRRAPLSPPGPRGRSHGPRE
jgi:succinate dehydrogenase/fumarate reductase flavoprotein subunit